MDFFPGTRNGRPDRGRTRSGSVRLLWPQKIHGITLVFVDRCVGMIVAPVEPIVFQRRNAGETFSSGRAGGGTALKIPQAGGRSVEQVPLFFPGGFFLG